MTCCFNPRVPRFRKWPRTRSIWEHRWGCCWAAHLGAEPALHPHVHGLVTAGGLSCDAAGRLTERAELAVVPARVFPAGAGAEPGLPGQFVAGLRAA